MTVQKIGIVGASGTLGSVVLAVLSAAPSVSVTVLLRESSKAKFSVPTRVFPDDYSVPALEEALRGLDGLVSTLPGSTLEPQLNLASAAAAAGLRRFIPADFGSVDSLDDISTELYPDYKNKRVVRAHCQKLAEQYEGFSWTSIVCGHFFDFGLRGGYLGLQLNENKATIFDDGTSKWSATTLKRTGEAILRIFTEKQAETQNRIVYIQSLCSTQLDLLESVRRVTGKTIEVSYAKADSYIKDRKEKSAAGDSKAREEILMVLGLTRANWEAKETFANNLLGLPDRNLDELVKETLDSTS